VSEKKVPIAGRRNRAERSFGYLTALRRAVPRRCAIWAGGQGFAFLQASPVAGVKVFDSTEGAIRAWQKITKTLPAS